jgi:alpha-beta hydrolase superfamily lysophospholipase
VEAAVLHALDAGAKDVVLFGWSMGGAIVLQQVSRSWTADRVRALVLDSPVIDWKDVLDHHAEIARLPRPISRLGLMMLADKALRRVVGTDGPVDLRRLDWVARASELKLPILLLHSDDDEFVPSGPSRRLAQARPDLVTFESFPHARHCREWNTDPQRWEREVARFLLRHL